MTTTKNTRSRFTSETIVAILDAAGYGGDYKDVTQRSGTGIAPTTLGHWIQRGRRQHEAGEKTALAAFYDLWEAAYPGGSSGRMSEARRMSEVRQAAKILQERAKKSTTEDVPEPLPEYVAPDRSTVCGCGGRKGRVERVCRKCLEAEGQL